MSSDSDKDTTTTSVISNIASIAAQYDPVLFVEYLRAHLLNHVSMRITMVCGESAKDARRVAILAAELLPSML